MPNQQSLKMEDMSEAYLRALCAANGYNVTRGGHDNDGYDVMIDCKGKVAEDSIVYSPKVEVQLKSSYSKIVENEDGSITYPLEVKNYGIIHFNLANFYIIKIQKCMESRAFRPTF